MVVSDSGHSDPKRPPESLVLRFELPPENAP
jgi:hypothetical protein